MTIRSIPPASCATADNWHATSRHVLELIQQLFSVELGHRVGFFLKVWVYRLEANDFPEIRDKCVSECGIVYMQRKTDQPAFIG